jgi:hypothetical protein
MSFGSQYNLNQRLTYLEYLLNNLPPIPPTSTLAEVLTAGNVASKDIEMNSHNIKNVFGETFVDGINIADSVGSISGNNDDILSLTYPATSFIPNASSSVSISGGGILAAVTNPAFGDDVYNCVLDPENSISINSYNSVTHDEAISILTTSSLKVGNNPNDDSSTGTIYCGDIFVNNVKSKNLIPLNLVSTDAINLNSSDNTNITSAASVVLNAFDNVNLNAATVITAASNQLVVTDGTTTNTINQLGYTTRNSVQNSAHYLNFSDNSATGIGAIQKTAGISCNPSLNSITASVFNGSLNGNSTTSTTATTSTYINSTQSSGVNQQSLCLFSNTPPNPNNSVQGAFNQNGVNYLTANPQGSGNFSINGGAGIHAYPYIVFTGADQTCWAGGSTYSQFTATSLKIDDGVNNSLLNSTSLTVATVNAALNGNASTSTVSTKSTISAASANANYTLLVATANSGNLAVLGSGSDLNYNPVSQTLSVKNMNVSGNENQTGIITTNVLKTDIMLQQVSYFSTQTLTIATVTDLKAYGTFLMSQYDSGSIIANSIITINLPTLPTDGSLDGYTFQLRKVRGGVNQTTPNWIINSVGGAFLIPNGNTLNAGSGGTNSTSNLNSFTQRYTIITYSGIGYYIGCAT